MDAWAGMFGVGVAEPGQAMYLSGTSEVLGLISAARVPTPGVIVFPEWRGLVLHAGPTQAGGAALDWLAGLLGRPAGELAGLADEAVRADSPLFLPHLEGERAPLWDSGGARRLRRPDDALGSRGPDARGDGGGGLLRPAGARGAGGVGRPAAGDAAGRRRRDAGRTAGARSAPTRSAARCAG